MIVTKEIDYRVGDTVCRGFLAYNDQYAEPLPGILVAHDWGGRGAGACNKARQLAELGYVAFALDMYGDARLGHDKVEKRALLTSLLTERRGRLIARVDAALATLRGCEQVDGSRVAAIGYCFGGLCVLDLIRSGADLKGVVSFHGMLTSPEGMDWTPLNTKVLVFHGYDDPLVKPAQVDEFAREMTARGVDWQVHLYGLTAHSFTDPLANDDEMGLHYNPVADRRSWESTVDFLRELF